MTENHTQEFSETYFIDRWTYHEQHNAIKNIFDHAKKSYGIYLDEGNNSDLQDFHKGLNKGSIRNLYFGYQIPFSGFNNL